jgi:heptosyltransferase-1
MPGAPSTDPLHPRLLLIKLSSLGDIVHALPVPGSLRATLPLARIAWVVERRWLPLVARHPDLDAVFTVDTFRLRAAPGTWPEFQADMRRIRAFAATWAVDLQGTLKSALVTRLAGAKYRLGLARSVERERGAHWLYNRHVVPESAHVVDQILDIAAAAVPPPGSLERLRQFPFPIPESAQLATRRWLEDNRVGPFVFLSPGGGWASKRWPTERFAELADRLQRDYGLAAVLNRGPGEQAMDDAFRRATAIRARMFSGDAVQLAAMLAQARLAVGGDTGPLHLAAALGTPVVALFGPTDPARNGPFSSRAIVLHKPHLASYPRGQRYSPNMLAISVDEVAAACGELLARSAGDDAPAGVGS